MRLHLVAPYYATWPFGAESHLVPALQRAGVDLVISDMRTEDLDVVRERLGAAYDCTLVLKGEQLTADLVKLIDGPRTLWFPDDIKRFPQHARHIQAVGPLFDLVYTTDKGAMGAYMRLGCRDVRFLPFAANPDVHRTLQPAHGLDLLFWGELSDVGHVVSERLARGQRVYSVEAYPQDIIDQLSAAKVVVVDSLSETLTPQKVYEALCCRCFVLARWVPEPSRVFADRKQVVYWRGADELAALAKEYLGRDEERMKIASAGRSEVLRRHTYEHRVETILADVRELMQRRGRRKSTLRGEQVSQRVLVLVGGGVGNILMATPMMEAVASLGHTVDVHLDADFDGCTELISGLGFVGLVSQSADDFQPQDYDVVVRNFMAQKKLRGHRTITHDAHPDWRKVHEIDHNMALARQLGYEGETPLPSASTSDRHFRLPRGTVALAPGCKPAWPQKKWDKFDELARRFEHVVLVGLPADLEPSYGYPERQWNWQENVDTQYVGGLSLADTAALISQCSLFIGNDSGLTHLAAALGVPTTAIFGPTLTSKNAPRGRYARVVKKELDCQPCQLTPRFGHKQVACPHMSCMRELGVEEVFAVAQDLLSEARQQTERGPRVTVLLVTYNQKGRIRECIESIRYYTDEEHRLVVVDNASTDGTREYLQTLDEATVILNDKNLLCCRATNQALARVETPYAVYLCSSHALVAGRHWLRDLLDYMEERLEVGMAGDVWACGWCFGPGRPTPRNLDRAWVEAQDKGSLEHVQGGAYVLRMETYRDIGPFDETFEHDFMDVEYSFRAMSRGWQLGKVPSVRSSDTARNVGEQSGVRVYHPAEGELRIRVLERLREAQRMGDQLISIVTCTYNRLPYVRECLESILEHTSSPFELFVYDNASTDGTRDYLKELDRCDLDGVHITLLSKNLGKGKAMNLGLARARGGTLITIDSDIRVPDGWAGNLAAVAHSSDRIGWVAPWYEEAGSPIPDYPDSEYETEVGGHTLICHPAVAGGVVCMTRASYEKLGPYHELGVYGGVDGEYAGRALRMGYLVGYTKEVVVEHLEGRGLPEYEDYRDWKIALQQRMHREPFEDVVPAVGFWDDRPCPEAGARE